MAKSQPLCTSAKSNPRDRVLGNVEKNSFTALPGKGGPIRLLPLQTMCRNPGGFDEGFHSHQFKDVVADKLRVCVGPALF